MSPERPGPRVARRWSLHCTFGELAFASLFIAVLTGVPLAVPFDIRQAYDSVAVMLLANPAAAFFRNVHYWSAQFFLVLTLAHAWDHLRRGTETRPRRGVWLRVTLTLPLAGFLMLSGFILKGDAEGQQAALILSTLLEQLPAAGHDLALLVLGAADNRQLLYLHHAATASILAWLFTAEHARAVWPRRVAVIEAFAAAAGVGLFLSPALHDGLGAVSKGPWYFLGLQELLHWVSHPAWVLVAGLLALALIATLPRLSTRTSHTAKWLLASLAAVYVVLTLVGVFFRGPAWAWGFDWSALRALQAHGLGRWWAPPLDALARHPIPVVLGRREGCLFCHASVKGLSASHAAEAVGCASCHAGDPFSLDKATAHAGMILVPGNLADAERSCGTTACHPGIPARVRGGLMNTMAGVIAVDRAAFRSAAASQPGATVEALGHEGADSHVRNLCASCHVGAVKSEWGGVHEATRGGGCNACHLAYSEGARGELRRYLAARAAGRALDVPSTHPNLALVSGRQHCFGCHSRSGRISTSYEGWQETEATGNPPGGGSHDGGDGGGQDGGRARYRTLEDGRVFAFVQADVHADKGMECVDCHTSREAMGDGTRHARKWEAVRVACEDCHFRGAPRTIPVERLDAESLKIARLRGVATPGRHFLATAGDPLLNTTSDEAGKWWLATKAGGRRLELRPPAAVCVEGGGHARLSCISCHSAWAPRCTGCHTRFDPSRQGVDLLTGTTTKGDWIETASGFSAVPPTLGVRTGAWPAGTPAPLLSATAAGTPAPLLTRAPGAIDPFIPGMVLTIDRNQSPLGRPDNVFRRFYARAFSHTVAKGARSCESCHSDPVALGYGEGRLVFKDARWQFVPRHAPGPDGLPADAWIGFLQERTAGVSTRPDVRPFAVDDQKRILTVGACLTCHPSSSPVMRGAVAAWRATLRRVSPRCVLPRW